MCPNLICWSLNEESFQKWILVGLSNSKYSRSVRSTENAATVPESVLEQGLPSTRHRSLQFSSAKRPFHEAICSSIGVAGQANWLSETPVVHRLDWKSLDRGWIILSRNHLLRQN